ncbi:hypothetical protein BFC19_04225 [Brochothrix thermosphacta]|uniref:KxYKxGKxW signal peptide domain-containing protein n=1 Tax=Brochothrix thermosphacta TaxID=2756 RepID=UPI000E73E0E2|nr:KxYKxGKxW signal peptide domain-containing protein [Brochothrix thermosphacta]ANZ94660.1 hypothetical protein BFC19_04225 [Brochothrix thermosphacta]
MNNNMNQENWRMWKRGKQWVFASALIIAVMGASGSPVIASASERQLAEVTSNEKSGHQTPPPIDEQETTYTGVTVMDGIQYKMLPNKSAECEIIARMPEAGKAPVLRGTVTFDGIEHKVVSMREDALVGSAEIIEMDQDFATHLLANPSAFQPSDVSMTKKVKLVLDQDISAAQASILTNHIVKQQSNHSILFTSKSETPKYTGPKEVSVVKGESVELNMDVAQYAYYHNEGTSDWLNEEHAGWVKPNGEKVTGSLLNIENAKSEDAGVYTYEGFDFFYFQNQYRKVIQ